MARRSLCAGAASLACAGDRGGLRWRILHAHAIRSLLLLPARARHRTHGGADLAGMNPFLATVLACLAGGVLSIVAAAGTLVLHPSRIARLVSFAVGALLGAVFLELLPHAL